MAKAFNCNFASAYGEIDAQRVRPGNLWCGDDEAREIADQLGRDAGYEPVYTGGLENARILEDFVPAFFAFTEDAGGPAFYRFARPGEL